MKDPRFVQRDPSTGKIVAHFANPQSYATEEVAGDHPDILAWYAKIEAAKAAYLEQKARGATAQLLIDERLRKLEQENAELKKIVADLNTKFAKLT